MSTWAVSGIVLSAIIAAVAARNAARATRNAHAWQVYAMRPRDHLGYALASTAFCAYFVAASLVERLPVIPVLAVYVLVAVFYGSSFARGFSDEP